MQTNQTSNNVCINGYPYTDEFSYREEEKPKTIQNTHKGDPDTISAATNKETSKTPLTKKREFGKKINTEKKTEVIQHTSAKEVDTISSVEKKEVDNAAAATKTALNKAREIKDDTEVFKKSVAKTLNSDKRPNIKKCLENKEKLEEGQVKADTIRANSTDCSGFIKMIYEDNPKFINSAIQKGNTNLSEEYKNDSTGFNTRYRGAELLRRGTEEVSKENVKEGDLIFFKDIQKEGRLTDYATHIGIVSKVETGKDNKPIIHFIHKSTNGGVVESSLESRARVNQDIKYKDLSPTFGRVN